MKLKIKPIEPAVSPLSEIEERCIKDGHWINECIAAREEQGNRLLMGSSLGHNSVNRENSPRGFYTPKPNNTRDTFPLKNPQSN